MKCEVCGDGMPEMASLIRVNEKGVAGVWRCVKCLTPEQHAKYFPVDLRELVGLITRQDFK